jgi:hypothetical protein
MEPHVCRLLSCYPFHVVPGLGADSRDFRGLVFFSQSPFITVICGETTNYERIILINICRQNCMEVGSEMVVFVLMQVAPALPLGY